MSKHSISPQPRNSLHVVDRYSQRVQEPREIGLEAIRRAGGPHRAVEALVERIEKQADRLERVRDSSCVFARALARINHRLADGLLRSGWDDPEWVALLAIRTAEHYLRAVQARDAGTSSHEVWARIFEAAEQRKTSVREELVLGLTAHLVHDLPQGLLEVGLYTPTGQTRLRDYHAINDPLGLAVEDLHEELTHRYAPWLSPVDRVNEGYASILSNEGVRIARATAWYNTERLLDEQMQTSTQAALRRWPLVTLYELIHPPVWSARFASRGMRLVSRWARSWPAKRQGRR